MSRLRSICTNTRPGPVGQALALALLHDGLNQHRHFDAARVQRSFTIGMTDIGEIVFLPALVERLQREAPGVTLRTARTTVTSLRHDMESGAVDLAIGPLPQLQAGFFQRRLFNQRYVCLFRQGHPLDRASISLADFQAAEHLVVESAGTGHGQIDELIRRAGIQRTVRLTVPHFVGVGHLLQRTDLVATVTERLADSLREPFALATRRHPINLPEVAINVFWHTRVHRSPADQWLRGVVLALFGEGGDMGN